MKLTQANPAKLPDPTAEAIHRNTDVRIAELQDQVQAIQPIAGAVVFRDIKIPNNGTARISHGLGRAPAFVWVSPIRIDTFAVFSPGVIVDVLADPATGAPIDRRSTIRLDVSGFSTAITVDVAVF